MNKLISVIIPTYGGGQYLIRCVDSVLAQTYQNIEVIVVDDNGIGTQNQLLTQGKMRYYENDKRVKYVCHEVNKNGAAARNTGFLYSSGEFIALLDDDDIYLPEKIEKQVADINALDDSYALVYCNREAFQNGKSMGVRSEPKSGYLFYEVMMHDVVIGSSSLLIRRKVWKEIGGFDETFRRHQDYEFTARIAHKYKVYGENFIGFNRYLLNRNSPQSIDIAYTYRKHFIEKMMPYIETLPHSQKKEVIYSNYMSVCIQYLKRGNIKSFLKMYNSIRPGFYGLKYIFRNFILVIKNCLNIKK